MDLIILNTDLNPIAVIDSYESLIWTDRYDKYGDFELYTSIGDDVLTLFKNDYYVVNQNSDHVMIIEKLLIKSDIENGTHITISGRSLESILDRRIIWNQIILDGNLQNGIKQLLRECITSPTDENRWIANFIFEESTDPAITGLILKAQYAGDNLYNVIQKICSDNKIGFKITINDNNQFVFKLYAGTDRSYDQTENQYVVFSPDFDNLLSSNYIESKTAFKNVALVLGEGQEYSNRTSVIIDDGSSGLNRREMLVDAKNLSTTFNGTTTIDSDDYNSQLRQKGKEELSKTDDIASLEGEAETTVIFRYGEHFFTGDIVQLVDEYGHEGKARVIEFVTSEDESGISTYPTFKTIEEGE